MTMKENWTYKKLTDICDIQYGYPFDSACFSMSPDDGMPLIRIRDVKNGNTTTYYKGDYPKEYIIHKGDYLVGMDGEFNIAPWRSEEALLNQRVCKVASKSEHVSTEFLYRFLTKELKKIEDETPFVTVKHLSAKRLNQVILPVPPLPEQHRIVSELNLLQSIIDKQQAQLKELDNLAQAVFYDMFGDPVENEKGWEVKRLEELSSLVTNGNTPKGGEQVYVKEGILFLRSQNVWRNRIEYDDIAYIDEKTNANMKKSSLHHNDILITKTGRINTENSSLGRAAIFTGETGTANINGHVYLIRLLDGISHVFVIRILTSLAYRDYIRKVCVGGIDKRQINKEQVDDFPIILPPQSLQQKFAAKIEAIEKQKATIAQSIAETQKLFNYTMDKYFG